MNPKQDEEIAELLWQNGQVVMKSQNQRPLTQSPPPTAANTGNGNVMIPVTENHNSQNNKNLLIQDDEMTLEDYLDLDSQQYSSLMRCLPRLSSSMSDYQSYDEEDEEMQAPDSEEEVVWHPVPVMPRPRFIPPAESSNGKYLIMTNRGKAKITEEEEEEEEVNSAFRSVDSSDPPPMLTMRAAPETSTRRMGIELAGKRRRPAFELTQSEMQVMPMRQGNNMMYTAHILGMQIGMNMGINRAVREIQNLVAAGTTVPPAAAHMGPISGVYPYHMPHVPAAPDSSRLQPANQSDSIFNSLGDLVPPDQLRIANPNFFDYEKYPSLQQLQEMMNQSNAGEAGTSGGQKKPKTDQKGP